MSPLKGGVGGSLTPFKFSAISRLEWKSDLFCENINMIFC